MIRALLACSAAAVLLLCVSSATTHASALAPTQPAMVQPESLEQGFIILVTDKSGTATSASPIVLASNHNGWNPNDPAQRLTQRSDGKWQIVLPKPKLDSRMAFKFARGSWETAETDAQFGDVPNRSLPMIDASKVAGDEPPIIELVIETFADKRPWEPARAALDPYRAINAVGTVQRVEVVGGAGDAPIVRDLLVWLPPGYADPVNADRRYPVLYLHDGQNTFEQLHGVPGEWKADETATALIASGQIEPLIIVGIPHAAAARSQEYLPIPVIDGVPARGDAYVEFLVREIVPRVERGFRVRSGARSTAVGGASLGAIISLHAATEHPEIFGRVLAESPSFLRKDRALFKFFSEKESWPYQVYLGMGGSEAGNDPADAAANEKYAQSARDFETMLKDHPRGPSQLTLVLDAHAVHNEDAWAERLPAALRSMFPAARE